MPARWSYYAWRECDSDWTEGAFSDKDVQALEDLFMGKTMTPVFVCVNLRGMALKPAITSDNMDCMRFDMPNAEGVLRREVDKAAIFPGVAFWDGSAYHDYDEQTSTLVVAATAWLEQLLWTRRRKAATAGSTTDGSRPMSRPGH